MVTKGDVEISLSETLAQGNPNLLLIGPPGTGKTRAMMRLRNFFEETLFDTSKVQFPFIESSDAFPGEIRTEWMTFHESTEYEDFVVGLRPEPSDNGGIELQPVAGTLLSLIDHVKDGNTGVLFIDEINRANVSRVFGEFISVMEMDKRLDSDGNQQSQTIALSLPQIAADEESIVEIDDPLTGEPLEFSRPYQIPRHLYIIASMNSLDRSTAPLDSALARRFAQKQFEPDYDLLREELESDFDPKSSLNANADVGTIAIALLYRINKLLSGSLGRDFQLGHGYLWELVENGLSEDEKLSRLAMAWEERILPKLRDLYRGRERQLGVILKLNADKSPYQESKTYVNDLSDMGATPPIEMPTMNTEKSLEDKEMLRDTFLTLAQAKK